MFEIHLSNNAAKFYEKSNDLLISKLNTSFDEIASNPFYGNNIKKLKGKLFG